MGELAGGGVTMVVVTHEMGFARRVADRIIFMDRSEIVEDAPTEGLAHQRCPIIFSGFMPRFRRGTQ